MFDIKLFFLLIIISLPGIAFTIPRIMQSMRGIIEANLKPDQKMPPLLILIVVSSLQATVLVAIAAAIGVSTSSVTGLSTPFLTSLLSDDNILEPLKQQLIAGVIGGMVCSAIFLPLYYVYFRPRLEVQTVQITENLRKNLSLSSKLLYGGIYEEVLVRWGLMGLFTWIASSLTGVVGMLEVLFATLLSGLLFAYGHLPLTYAAGAKKSPMLTFATLSLNGWASLVFGWLLWSYGLTAAIFAHMLLHCIWSPLEKIIKPVV